MDILQKINNQSPHCKKRGLFYVSQSMRRPSGRLSNFFLITKKPVSPEKHPQNYNMRLGLSLCCISETHGQDDYCVFICFQLHYAYSDAEALPHGIRILMTRGVTYVPNVGKNI